MRNRTKLRNLLVCLNLLLVFCLVSPGKTAQRGLGLGIILGEPTGVSMKTWLNNNNAIDGALAWSFGNEDAFHLHFDYLVHKWNAIRIDRNSIPFYYGIGGRFKFENDSRFGVRFPLGITLFVKEAPIDLFLEIVPILDLAPETDFDINAAIGARYYFH